MNLNSIKKKISQKVRRLDYNLAEIKHRNQKRFLPSRYFLVILENTLRTKVIIFILNAVENRSHNMLFCLTLCKLCNKLSNLLGLLVSLFVHIDGLKKFQMSF